MASQQAQKIGIRFIQRRPNVSDVCPALYKCCINALCLLGYGWVISGHILYLITFLPWNKICVGSHLARCLQVCHLSAFLFLFQRVEETIHAL